MMRGKNRGRNGDTHKVGAGANIQDDALSLEALDQVVGGAGPAGQNTEQLNNEDPPYVPPVNEGPEYTEGGDPDGDYTPPPPPPPAHLDPAVTQIAANLTGTDPHTLFEAGESILALIQNNQARPEDAMFSIHNAVTVDHALTGEQAIGLLAGIYSQGDGNVATAVYGEITALIDGNQVTVDDAIKALAAGTASTDPDGLTGIANLMSSVGWHYAVSGAQMLSDVNSAITSSGMSGNDAVSLLLATANYDWQNILPQIGTEIGQLVSDGRVTADDVLAGMNSGMDHHSFSGQFAIPVLAAAAEASDAMRLAAGQEIAHLYPNGGSNLNYALSQLNDAIAAHTISAEHAIGVLTGYVLVAGENASYGFAAMDQLISSGQVTGTAAAGEIHHLVTSDLLTAERALTLFAQIMTNGPYGMTAAAFVEIGALVSSGDIGAAQAISFINTNLAFDRLTGDQAFLALLSIGARDASLLPTIEPMLDSLIANDQLVSYQPASLLIQKMDSGYAALDNLLFGEFQRLVNGGIVSPSDATAQLVGLTHSSSPQHAYDGLAWLIDNHNVSASAVFSAIATPGISWNGWAYGPVQEVAGLGAAHPELLPAMGAQIAALIGPNFTEVNALSAVTALVSGNRITADQAIGVMLATATAAGTAAMVSAAGSAIAGLMASSQITSAQAMADIHNAVAGQTLNVDVAIRLLANVAAVGNAAVDAAVNTELNALVSANLVTADHAISVLDALGQTAGPALTTAIAGAIAALDPSHDPVEALLTALPANPSAAQLTSLADQLNALLGQNATTIENVLADIDAAVNAQQLSGVQALTVMVSLAAHGDTARQDAVGGALAVLVAHARVGSQEIVNTFGAAAASGAITIAQVVEVLLAAETKPGLTASEQGAVLATVGDAVVTMLRMPNTHMDGNTWANGILGMLTAHTMTGPQAIAAMSPFIGLDSGHFWAAVRVESWVTDGTLSMADVHAAVVTGSWPVDDAIISLGHFASAGDPALQAAAIAEVSALIAAGVTDASRVAAAIHGSLFVDPSVYLPDEVRLSADQAVILGMALAAAHPAMQDALAQDFGALINQGRLGSAQLAAHVGGLMSAQIITLDQTLGMLARIAANANAGSPVVTDVIFGFFNAHLLTLEQTMAAAATLPGGGPDLLQELAAPFLDLVSSGQITAAQIAMFGQFSLPSGQMASLLTGLIADGNASQQPAAQAELVALIGNGRITAGDAMSAIDSAVRTGDLAGDRALSLLLGLEATTPNAALQAAIVAELNALVIGRNHLTIAQVIAGIDAAFTSQTLSADQTVQLVTDLFLSSGRLANAAAREMEQLAVDGQIPASAFIAQVKSALSGDAEINALVKMTVAGPTLLGAVCAEIVSMMQQGHASTHQVTTDIEALVTSGAITMPRALGLFAVMAADSIANIHTAMFSPIFQAMKQEMHSLAERGLASPEQIIDSIGRSGSVSLLYAFCSPGDPLQSLAIAEIDQLARAGRIDCAAALAGVNAFSNLSNGFSIFFTLVNGGPPAMVTAFASMVVQFITGNAMTIDTALSNINGAWSGHTLSAERAFTLMAGIGGDPSGFGFRQPVDQQMKLMINAGAIDDLLAIRLLLALGSERGGSMQEFVDVQIDSLLHSVQTLVDAGARGIGISIADAADRLVHEVFTGQNSMYAIGGAIAAAVTSDALTPAQGVAFLLRVLGAGTGIDSSFAANVGASSMFFGWFGGAVHAFEGMAQNGLTGDILDRAIDRAIASNLMTADQAVTTLAAAATVAGLQQTVATELASLVRQQHITATQATQDFLRGFGSAPPYLDPGQALATLAMAIDAPRALPSMADGVGAGIALWAQWHVSPADLTNEVAELVNAQTITPAQGLSLLVGIGAHGNTDVQGNVGHVLGTMLANGQIAIADIHRAIVSHALPVDNAVVVLASMTEQGSVVATNAALAELSRLVGSNLIAADQAVSAIAAAMHPFGSQDSRGITGPQAVAALLILGTPAAIAAIQFNASSMFPDVSSPNGRVDVMVDVAGHLPGRLQADAFQALAQACLAMSAVEYVPAAVDAAVGAQTLTAKQAVTLLTGVVGAAYNDNLFNSAIGPIFIAPYANEIASLISDGLIGAQGAIASIHSAVASHVMSPSEAIVLMACTTTALAPSEKAFEAAMGREIAAMVSGGLISASQAMADIENAVETGSFTIHQAVITLAEFATVDASSHSTAVNEIAKLISEGKIGPADAVNDIRAALTARVVTADQALTLLIDLSGASGAVVGIAAGEAISAMVAARQTSAAHVLDVVLNSAGQSASGYQAVAGATLASLVAHNQLTPAQAIGGVEAGIAAGDFTADQSVGLLAGLAVAGDAAETAVAGELSHLITTGKMTADHAVALLMGAAISGGAGVQNAVGAEIAALVAAHHITATQAMAALGDAAGTAAAQAFNVLIAASAHGDVVLQVAAGKACVALAVRDPFHMADLMASIGNAVGSGRITADQAVDILIGATTVSSQATIQALAAAQLHALVAHGQIEAAQALGDIQDAVTSGALSIDQTLVALLNIGLGAPPALQQAANDEVGNLVSAGLVTAIDAATMLLNAGGPSYLPVTFDYYGTAATMATLNRVGVMLNNLVEHGLLPVHDAVSAVAAGIGRYAFDNAVQILFSMSANGQAATAVGVGAGVADLLASFSGGSLDAQHIVTVIDRAVLAHAMPPAAAVVFMANVLAANPGGSSFATFAAEAAALCNRQLGFDAYGLIAAAINAADVNPNAAIGAGAMMGAIWTNIPYYSGGDFAPSGHILRAIDNAVTNGSLTVDEAILMTAGLRLGGRDASVVDGVSEILSLISSGKTTFIHAVDVLATAAGHATPEVLPGLSSQIFSLAHFTGGNALEQAVTEIGALVSSNAITGMQGVAVLSAFASAGEGLAQLAAGKQMGMLVAAGHVTAGELTQFIYSNIFAHIAAGNNDNHQHLAIDQAVVVMLGLMSTGDQAARSVGAGVIAQQIAWSNISAVDAIATIHGAMTAHQVTADQAIAALADLASVNIGGGPALLGPVTAEICALVSTQVVTADQAVAALLAAAHTGASNEPLVVGGVIHALIEANLITATRAVADIHAAVISQNLAADRAVVVLAAIASATDNVDLQKAMVAGQGALIASGAITAEQVMAAIVNAATDPYAPQIGGAPRLTAVQAMYLLTIQMAGSPAQQHAAAAQIASVIDNHRWGGIDFSDFWYPLQDARSNGAITFEHVFTLLADIGAHASPELRAQAEINFRHMILFEETITPTRGVELLTNLAGDGTDATAVYAGREIAHLVTQSGGDVTVADAMEGINDALRTHWGVPGFADNAVIVLAAMSANGVSRADIVHQLSYMADYRIDFADMMTAFGSAIDAGAFSADQAVTILVDLYNIFTSHFAGNGALVVAQLGTMIVDQQITLPQLIADLHEAGLSGQLSLRNEIRLLAGLAIDTRIDAGAACGDEIAAVTIAEWNIAPTDPAYGSMLAGLKLVTSEMLASPHNDPSAAIANLTAFAGNNHLPADALLATLFIVWTGVVAVDDSAQGAQNQIGDVIKEHLASFETERTLAEAVASGAYSADIAAAILSEIVSSYYGNLISMPVGMAGIAQQVTAAVDVLNVQIVVAHDAPLVLSGQMTAADAIAHVLGARGSTGFAAELGFADLAIQTANPQLAEDYLHPELSGATGQEVAAAEAALARAEAAHLAIVQFIGERIAVGTTAEALLAASGVMTDTAIIVLIRYEARAGRAGEPADLVENVALATLMEHGASYGGVGYSLIHDDALVLKMITGVAALMTLDMAGMEKHMQTLRMLNTAHITNVVGPVGPHLTDDEAAEIDQASSKNIESFTDAWWAMRDANVVINSFGHAGSLTGQGSSSMVEGWVRFGANFVTQGVPLASAVAGLPVLQTSVVNNLVMHLSESVALTTDFAGTVSTVNTPVIYNTVTIPPPEWAMEALGRYAPESLAEGGVTVNITPAMVFTAVSVSAKVLPIILAEGAVADFLGKNTTEGLTGACGMISAACDLITNTVTGTVTTFGMDVYQVFNSQVNVFEEMGLLMTGRSSVGELTEDAISLGENLFSLMFYGTDVNAFADTAVSAGQLLVDLFTGNTEVLKMDAYALGESLGNLITSNHYIMMMEENLNKFANAMADAATMTFHAYISFLDDLAHSELGGWINDNILVPIFGGPTQAEWERDTNYTVSGHLRDQIQY